MPSKMARKLLTSNKDKTLAVVNHQVLDLLKPELLAKETESILLQVTAYDFQGNTRVILIIRQLGRKRHTTYTHCVSLIGSNRDGMEIANSASQFRVS